MSPLFLIIFSGAGVVSSHSSCSDDASELLSGPGDGRPPPSGFGGFPFPSGLYGR